MLPLVDLPPEIPAPTLVIQRIASEISWPAGDYSLQLDPKAVKAPQVIVAVADKAREKVIGVCIPSETAENLGVGFDFGTAAQHYLIQYEGRDPMEVDISRVKIRVLAILQHPQHGRIVLDANDPYGGGSYIPAQDFFGKDRVEANVSVGEHTVRVVFNFAVSRKATDQLERDEIRKLCPKGLYWKISGTGQTTSLTSGLAPGFR